MKNIDLSRSESRFIIPESAVEHVQREIYDALLPVSFSNNPITQTIYLNDDELSVPWGVSLKARRYVAEPAEEIKIDPFTLYSCELKKEGLGSVKNKVKKMMMIFDFCDWASEEMIDQIGKRNLKPHIASQYLRRHFVSRKEKNFRVTIDSGIQYGLFEKPFFCFVWLGEEKGAHLEIKADDTSLSGEDYKSILRIIEEAGGLPVISKKHQAYNFHGLYLDRFGSKIIKELKDIEIEAKFALSHQNPAAFFQEIRKLFLRGRVNGFYIDPFPYSKLTASTNHYWISGGGEKVLKLLYKGGRFRVVTKENSEILPDHHGLSCILKRQEEKGKRYEHTPENLKQVLGDFADRFGELIYAGYLQRSRLAFWPENIRTGRLYHLTLDRCTRNSSILYQLEIEYVGCKTSHWQPSESPEEEIVAELKNLVWQVYCLANQSNCVLLPGVLTKLDWIKSH